MTLKELVMTLKEIVMSKRLTMLALGVAVVLAGCANSDSYSGDVYSAEQAKTVQTVSYGTITATRAVRIERMSAAEANAELEAEKRAHAAQTLIPPGQDVPPACAFFWGGWGGVWNGRAVRLMATDPGYSQSGMYLEAPNELYFRYTQFYALGPHFVPGASRVLMLGGGGYSVPKWLLSEKTPLAKPADARVTVVELDPAMTDTARRWFALRDDPRLTVRHEDARAFLNRQREQYDLVFVDVFNSHYAVPFQMGTREAAAALRKAVAPGGVMLMNVISAVEGPDGQLFQSIFNALEPSFAEVRVYLAGGEAPDRLQNLMVAAFAERREDSAFVANADAGVVGSVANGTGAATAGRSPGAVELSNMLASRYTGPLTFATPALTDDFAPVERYTLVLLRQ